MMLRIDPLLRPFISIPCALSTQQNGAGRAIQADVPTIYLCRKVPVQQFHCANPLRWCKLSRSVLCTCGRHGEGIGHADKLTSSS